MCATFYGRGSYGVCIFCSSVPTGHDLSTGKVPPVCCAFLFHFFFFLFNFIWSSRQLTDGWLLVASVYVSPAYPSTILRLLLCRNSYDVISLLLRLCVHVMIMKEKLFFRPAFFLFLSLRSPTKLCYFLYSFLSFDYYSRRSTGICDFHANISPPFILAQPITYGNFWQQTNKWRNSYRIEAILPATGLPYRWRLNSCWATRKKKRKRLCIIRKRSIDLLTAVVCCAWNLSPSKRVVELDNCSLSFSMSVCLCCSSTARWPERPLQFKSVETRKRKRRKMQREKYVFER